MGDLRTGVAAPRIGVYEGAIRALLAAGRPLDAFQAAERARARLLLELMADRASDGPRDRLRARIREASLLGITALPARLQVLFRPEPTHAFRESGANARLGGYSRMSGT